VWRHPFGFSAGASGAIFGVAGALITALYLGKLPVPKAALTSTLKSLLFFAGFNLLIGQAVSGIDNSAHLGGLITGLFLGALLASTVTGSEQRRHRVRLYTFGTTALVLAGAFMLVRGANAYVVDLTQGSEALDAGKISVAVEKLGAASKKKPDFAPAFAMLGNAYLRSKNTNAAEAALRRSLQLDSRSRYAKYNLGLVYLRSARLDQAKDLFSELANSDPKDTRSLLLLGATLDEMKDHQEAVATLKRAAEIDPKDAETYGYLGSAQLSAGQYDDAIRSFEEALRLSSDYKGAALGLAAAYRAKGMNAQAAAALERAASMNDLPETR
jgi:tetratricopeptide (TPR) repeat protein